MHWIAKLAGSAVLASSADAQAAPVAMSPAARADLQCFVLNMIAVGSTTVEEVKEAGTVGTMYFYGKLRVEAPELDLVEAVRQELVSFEGNPQADAIAQACDFEVHQRGDDLMRFGEELMKAEGQSSPSSS
jgi:hypothetical protein